MMRSYNPNLAKTHRCYRVDEVADLYRCHKNTVRRWLSNGLDTVDDSRPLLIQGGVLKSFLKGARASRKRACGIGELYCMRCKSPRKPLGNRVVWIPQSESKGRLKGCCEMCGSTINRFAKTSDLDRHRAVWTIQIEGDLKRITDSGVPALNGDLDGDE